MQKLKEEFQSALDRFKKELSSIRTGRAHPSLVEDAQVDCYGSRMPVKQLANISIPEARTIFISPWDKNLAKDIEKAIGISLQLNVQSDSGGIRVNIPALTEERRKELAKVVGKKLEESRIAMRGIRRDILEEADSLEGIGETEIDLLKKKIQAEVDNFNKESEKIAKEKEEEIMKV